MVFFFFIQGSVFWCAKLKSEVYFPPPLQENLENSEENRFFEIIENIRYGGSVYLRQAAMGLAISAVAPPKASLWFGKINQLHPFYGRR